MFLVAFRRLNNNKALPSDLQARIEEYFHYKWKRDRNQAF
jgi:hypothetical protein